MADNEVSDHCSQTFVALDEWFNQIGGEKGEDAIRIVRVILEKNIKSNIIHYEELATAAELVGQHQLARKNRLVAHLYKSIFVLE